MSPHPKCFDRGEEWAYDTLPTRPVERRIAARALCAGCPVGLQACARAATSIKPQPLGMVWAGVALPDWKNREHANGMVELRLIAAGIEVAPVVRPGPARCAGTCGRLLRPNRTRPQDYPQPTVIAVAHGKCGACYQHARQEQAVPAHA
jgi:hypothetical protein